MDFLLCCENYGAMMDANSDVLEDKREVQIQLFNFWKWRALAKRRNILYPLACICCTVFWGVAHYVTETTLFYNQGHTTDSTVTESRAWSFYRALPNVMYAVHILAFLLFITQVGQKIINDAQGKRLVIMNAVSLNGCMIFCIISRFNVNKGILTDSEVGSLVGMTVVLCLIVSHHCGMSQSLAWLNFFVGVVLWIVWFVVGSDIKWTGVGMIIATFMIFLCVTCEDFELRLAYLKFKTEETREGLAGAASDNSVSNSHRILSKDLSHVLKLVDHSHALLHGEILGSSQFRGNSASLEQPGAAQLMHIRLLCQALMAASMSQKAMMDFEKEKIDKSPATRGSGVYLSQQCAKVFGLLEATAGTALALYTSAESPDFFLAAYTEIYQMVLYLLVSDAVLGQEGTPIGSNLGICSVKLVYHNNKWQVNIQIAQALSTGPGWQGVAGDRTGSDSIGSSGYHDSFPGTSFGVHGGANDDDDELEAPENRWIFEGVGKHLSTDPQLRNTHHTPLTRLANKIAATQANVQISTEPPEVISGVVFHRRSFPVPGDAPYGITGQSLSLSLGVLQEWVLVEQHAIDETALLDLKGKLELLQVPVRICKGAVEYKIWNQRHYVVVVSESALESYYEQMHADLIRLSEIRVVLAGSGDKDLVDGDTLRKIEAKYQFKDAHALSRLASLSEVHQTILRVVQSQRPRVFGKPAVAPAASSPASSSAGALICSAAAAAVTATSAAAAAAAAAATTATADAAAAVSVSATPAAASVATISDTASTVTT